MQNLFQFKFVHFLNKNVCSKCVIHDPIMIKIIIIMIIFLNPYFKILFLISGCSESPV